MTSTRQATRSTPRRPQGATERQRHLVRAGRPGQGPERCPGGGRRGGTRQRPGDGERRSRDPRRGRLDHRRDDARLADLLRLWRRQGGRRPTPRPRSSPGPRTCPRWSRWSSRSADRHPGRRRRYPHAGAATLHRTRPTNGIGVAAAIAAAIVYGAAYPATAVALRSFSPLAVAGLSCTLALAIVIGLAAAGILPRPALGAMSGPRLARLIVLALLGGVLFITGINLAVAIVGPTITGFVAPLYAIFGTLFAVPLLGETVRSTTLARLRAGDGRDRAPRGRRPGRRASRRDRARARRGRDVRAVPRPRTALERPLRASTARSSRSPTSSVAVRCSLVAAVLLDQRPLIPADPDPAAVVAILTLVFGSSTSGNLLLMARSGACRRVGRRARCC